MMIALKTIDLRNDFKRVSNIVNSGGKVLISRPHNENLVLISEKEYNELDKARRNADYINMIDNSIKEVAKGKTISFTIDELDALENMSMEETQLFVAEARKRYIK